MDLARRDLCSQNANEITSMDLHIRRAEPRIDRALQWYPVERPCRCPIASDDGVRHEAASSYLVIYAKRPQHRQGIGAQADACSDLTQSIGLLKDVRLEASARERKGGG